MTLKKSDNKNKNNRSITEKKPGGFYISAVKRNSGKTTVSIAVSRTLRNKGYAVQPFKKGPDFIDPMWLTAASGSSCYNLDLYFISEKKIRSHFVNRSLNSDISIVEGNHGLHDSIDLLGKSSNAEMSKLLGLPVVLVVDVGELNRGVVPLLLGFRDFDKDVDIKGIILNKVHSKRHEKNLQKAIKYYTDFKLVGNIPNDVDLSIKQRHLGLLSTLSADDIEGRVSVITAKISEYLDIDGIIKISGAKKVSRLNDKNNNEIIYSEPNSNYFSINKNIKPGKTNSVKSVKVGLAYDSAFNFYYNENIEAIENEGCEIVKFSPLSDLNIPEVDAVYIGGGFPEILSKKLEANKSMRKDLKRKIEEGLPVYAECGGLMYLCKSISFDDINCEMVGIIDAEVKLTKKPKGHGYTKLSPIWYDKNSLFWFEKIKIIKGHEFHHSYLELSSPDEMRYAFNMLKGYGVNGLNDGIAYKNSYAAYTHIYAPSSPAWFKNWVSFIKKIKE